MASETTVRRSFTTCERAVLKSRRVDEEVASQFPARLSAVGVCDLVAAGVPSSVASTAAGSLSAKAILCFLRAGSDLQDVEYDQRFYDPSFLADSGVAASVANAYPHHLDEIDVVRLHEAGFGPRDSESIPPSHAIANVVKLAASGVSAADVERFGDVADVPPEMLARCVKAGLDSAQLARWMSEVGPIIRTNPATLVQVALASKRIDDPEGFRFDLLRVAARSVLATDGPEATLRPIVDRLLRVLQSNGHMSTTIPDSWTRERLLFVGPDRDEVCVIAVTPNEPLSFDYGELDQAEALERIDRYIEALG